MIQKASKWVPKLLCILLTSAAIQPVMAQLLSTPSMGQAGPAMASDPNSYDFQPDLFTGRFTYKVPINLPPARQGSQPPIALGYNSTGGNGWCGVGWSLEVGYIARDTRKGVPVLWGGTNALPQYDDTKGFVASFGGIMSTLVRVGPTNQNPIVYRQQVDTSLLTYNFYTNNHWEIVDKKGNTYFFGEGTTNRMANTKTNWAAGVSGSTFRWALDRSIDANGNETFFNYVTDGGMLYLTNVLYNANTNSPSLGATHEVDFVLTNRPDTNFNFLGNYRLTTGRLLSEIQIKVSGANVRKYVLRYTNSYSTLRSLLASVTEYGADFSTALPTTTFNYQVNKLQFGAATNWGPVSGQGNELLYEEWGAPFARDSGAQYGSLIDVNGDGLLDRVMRTANSPYTNWVVQLNTGSGFGTNTIWGGVQSVVGSNDVGWNSIVTDLAAGSADETYVAFADLNGDGLPDRIMRAGYTPFTNFAVQLNDGTNFHASTNWGPVSGQGYESIYSEWGSPFAWDSGAQYIALVDINGDGLPDRVMRNGLSPYTNWVVQLNTGAGFGTNLIWGPIQSPGGTDVSWSSVAADLSAGSADETFVAFVDLNGDGLPDRVMRTGPSPWTNFVVQFNNGAGFEASENWGPVSGQGNESIYSEWGSPFATDSDVQYLTLMDVNGDGLPDRVMRNALSPYTNWVVQLNTGTGFGSNVIWGPIQSSPNTLEWNSITSELTAGSANETYIEVSAKDALLTPLGGK